MKENNFLKLSSFFLLLIFVNLAVDAQVYSEAPIRNPKFVSSPNKLLPAQTDL